MPRWHLPRSSVAISLFLTAGSGGRFNGSIAIWGPHEQAPCWAAVGSEIGSMWEWKQLGSASLHSNFYALREWLGSRALPRAGAPSWLQRMRPSRQS